MTNDERMTNARMTSDKKSFFSLQRIFVTGLFQYGLGVIRHLASALLRTVSATGLLAAYDTQCIERPAYDLITHARKVTYTTATH